MARVSVILNTYNSARFLSQTIATVLAQSFTDFELLIIDDGSQDDTLGIAAQVSDPRLQIQSYPNGGIATSRNRGLSQSTAELVAFLDHDDLWHPDKLAQQVIALDQAGPRAALAYSWIELISEAGDLIRPYPPCHNQGNVYSPLLINNFLHTASNPLIRRQAAIAVGGFDNAIYGADDWDFFIRLAAQYEFALSPHHHVQYRMVKGSSSSQVEAMAQAGHQVIQKSFQGAPPHLQSLKAVALGSLYQYLCFKSLEKMNRPSAGLAWHYLRRSRRHQPALWSPLPLTKALCKIGLGLTLPSAWNQQLLPWLVQHYGRLRRSSHR